MKKEVMVEVSARHVHLSQEHVDILFGIGYQLTPDKWLSQPGQFLSKERVNVIGSKKTFENVAILGPVRKNSQFELSLTDCRAIGVEGVLRESGYIDDTPGITIETPNGKVLLDRGVIVAKRHIHMTPQDASDFGVEDKQIVKVKVNTDREVIFGDVVVRVHENFALAMHIDTDEANAAFIGKGVIGEVIM
ncbi:phosphate propanoyltransferase [Mobilitalea sibirica]|uniref:Phosphate propanoyltransferase n=1 Tax=Mobilitalea sibirica TaxID=1462919 RepID=A0A8J7H2K6_9FIRM|nr:phosphate propanoyltransferase [Mobilitalea sibirica]MBH1941038.1 phosphate propanoyltransferase [Mobilitalea sibirica]